MGFTHYLKQLKSFTATDWKSIQEDVTEILKNVQHVQGVSLGNGNGDGGSQPEVTECIILFNGLGDDSHEGFLINRRRPLPESWQDANSRGSDYCKTERKPYDIAVTAVLSYLCSVYPDKITASSDGNGHDWLAGIEVARQAVNRHANVIDIPIDIRKADRWDYIARRRIGIGQIECPKYAIEVCWDGCVYVFDTKDESRSCRFESQDEARTFFGKFRERTGGKRWKAGRASGHEYAGPLFDPTGSFTTERWASIARQQLAVLREVVENAECHGSPVRPPLFARPRVILGTRDAASVEELWELAA